MLLVRLYVNAEHIGTVTARRIKGDTKPNSINTYLIDEGTKTLKHRYGDGAAKLAQKMLKHLGDKTPADTEWLDVLVGGKIMQINPWGELRAPREKNKIEEN